MVVARGYLNRPDLTAEKFIPNRFMSNPSERDRLYRTGDLVRYLPSGDIEFLGRADGQVKLRGFRIETGEIERAIGQSSYVKEVVVVLREDTSEAPYLAAYLVLSETPPLDFLPSLKGFLTAKLPAYMVPTAFTVLDRIPITPNGKTDKANLPKPGPSEPLAARSGGASKQPLRRTISATPLSNMAKTLMGIWQQVLSLPSAIDIDANFFDVGGNSLSLTMVHGLLPPTWKNTVTLMDLFKYSTLRTLCEYLAAKTSSQSPDPASTFLRKSMHRKRSLSLELGGDESIAIIGMGCIVPGAESVDASGAIL